MWLVLMNSTQIGDLRFFVFTDCSFTDEHVAIFLQLSGLPITESELTFNDSRRTCEWRITLDPSTYVGPVNSISEHIWHVTNLLYDKADFLKSLRAMNCRFWLRAYCGKIDQTIGIDLPIMERLVEWDIILQLIPEEASEPCDEPKSRSRRF
ncbi:hypothetical protein [Planctomycetes bacterium TBK1r]|uniref:DUF4279 domain-containing protein n=1 Tax=Stieleria magnilauensis TaxID=2527963 RepID=A0ABX5Y022_9BACT|nr:hypothetical protein TBK1r_66350 [Planctomycetes bacterium TBK1r]